MAAFPSQLHTLSWYSKVPGLRLGPKQLPLSSASVEYSHYPSSFKPDCGCQFDRIYNIPWRQACGHSCKELPTIKLTSDIEFIPKYGQYRFMGWDRGLHKNEQASCTPFFSLCFLIRHYVTPFCSHAFCTASPGTVTQSKPFLPVTL